MSSGIWAGSVRDGGDVMMEAKRELQALLDTALRVRNEGLEERFKMYDWGCVESCGTVACLAGWHIHFKSDLAINGYRHIHAAHNYAIKVGDLVSHVVVGHARVHVPMILFGPHRGSGNQALTRQIKAIRWFLHRIEALEEYERIRAMPRKERRKLRIAA